MPISFCYLSSSYITLFLLHILTFSLCYTITFTHILSFINLYFSIAVNLLFLSLPIYSILIPSTQSLPPSLSLSLYSVNHGFRHVWLDIMFDFSYIKNFTTSLAVSNNWKWSKSIYIVFVTNVKSKFMIHTIFVDKNSSRVMSAFLWLCLYPKQA